MLGFAASSPPPTPPRNGPRTVTTRSVSIVGGMGALAAALTTWMGGAEAGANKVSSAVLYG